MYPRHEPHGLKQQALMKVLDLISGKEDPSDAIKNPSLNSSSSSFSSGYRKYRRATDPTVAGSIQPHDRKQINYNPPLTISPLGRRKRPLTPPNQLVHFKADYDDQVNSRFLNLPEEVLERVFREVVGWEKVHVLREEGRLNGEGRLRSSRCRFGRLGEHEVCEENACRGDKLPTGVHILSASQLEGGWSVINLLQSCRKVYAMVTPLLYTTTPFDFDSMDTLVDFSTTVLPRRFDSIKSLSLSFRFDLAPKYAESVPTIDASRWVRTWAIVGSMKGLEWLWVRIAWARKLLAKEEERRLKELIPVAPLKGGFVVRVTELRKGEKGREVWPFTFRRDVVVEEAEQ